ncbi:MAG: DUF1064 domain-containing protein [Clostridia bacterium]|nr:DUF1064 domain-containing protein [Clostridia bacterium]
MTSKAFRQIAQPKSKYYAKKTVVNGVEYDSKKESKRAVELEYLERIGKIKNLQKQVRFILQEGYVNNYGQKIRPISYIADFVYEENGQKIVEDVKSPITRTPVYKIKKKLFEAKFKDYVFLES